MDCILQISNLQQSRMAMQFVQVLLSGCNGTILDYWFELLLNGNRNLFILWYKAFNLIMECKEIAGVHRHLLKPEVDMETMSNNHHKVANGMIPDETEMPSNIFLIQLNTWNCGNGCLHILIISHCCGACAPNRIMQLNSGFIQVVLQAPMTIYHLMAMHASCWQWFSTFWK